MATKTKTKKSGKKLDGKALAAKRKTRDSVAQFVKDELAKGKRNVAKILAGAKDNFPKTKATPGYVRFLAKKAGIKDMEATERSAPKAKAKTKAKVKAKAKRSDDSPTAALDPAS